jgi:hypothetical protein
LADARAIPPLVAALPDWDVSPTIGDALKKLGWKPTCDEERVRFWISQKDRKSLTQDWKTTKRVLLSDARSGEERKVETAVLTFIALGSNEVVPDLARLLSASGTKNLALIYLNSGNGGLRAAADDWASQHGYEVMTIPGRASGPAWGSW